jgi:hypothetical protein
MSDTGKQSPLGVNVNNALLTAEGFTINPQFASWVGSSRNFPDYSFGRICQETVLRVLTWAIHEGYYGNPDGRMTKITMDNIITIGNGTTRIPITSIVSGQTPGTDQYYFDVTYNNPNVIITVGQYIRITGASPDGYNGNWLVSEVVNTSKFRIYTTAFYGVSTAPGAFIVDTQVPGLGNAKPMVYTWEWLNGPYGTGKFNLGDSTGWGGSTYQDPNPAIQWAYIRLLALQAWMEFNYNSTLETGNYENPKGYRDFIQSFQNAAGFISYSNDAILSIDNSKDFLDGTFSNMNDLITADITNVNLALKAWGQDLIILGKALDLSSIDNFGMPSALLKTLAKYNAITKNLGLAIVSAGIPTNELGTILSNLEQPTIEQERKLYATFVLTVGGSLEEILIALNCKTEGLESLADLLDPKKLFPNSYKSLTVPLYRDTNTPITTTTTTNPTVVTTNLSNSKISYLLYTDQGGVNSQLTSSQVVQKVGIQLPPGPPLISEGAIGNQDGVITIQEPARGFGSYLSTIVPPNIATTAGAFSTSMKQIKNIKEIPIEKFAQVVTNLETMAVINSNGTQTPLLTNTGTPNNVPTNLNLRARGRPLVALGSGPQGSYTVSDFFGCMSGLPYNGSSGNSQLGIPESGLEGIYNKLKELATTKLFNIYDELYLAVTWERARTYISQNVFSELVQPYIRNKDNPDYDPNPDIPNPAYDPSLPIGPGNEPTIPNPKYDPYLYLNAASGEGTNEENFQPRIDNWFYTVNFGISVNGGGYGRGSAPLPDIRLYPNNCKGSIGIRMGRTTANIPNEFGRIFETGKSFGTKYLFSTTTVFQSSKPPAPVPPEEFLYIQGPPIEMLPVLENGNKNPNGQNNDPGWLAGSQGGGNPGYNAWPAINAVIQGYINQANQEIDRINSVNRPSCIKLNNYWNSTGYQLTIEQRARMNGLKPPLPDSRENFLSLYPTTMYTFTDSLPNYGKSTEPHMYAQTIENIANWNTIGGVSMVAMMRQDRNQARLAAIGVELDNNIPDKLPYEQQRILISNGTLPTGSNNSNIPSGSTISQPGDPFVPITTPPSTPVVIRDRVPVIPVQPGTINIGTNEYVVVSPVYGGQNPGSVIDTGGPLAPGSFAGSPYSNLIPPNLNSWYSSSTLMPSTYTVNDAIEEVILCNCDCWNLA